MFLQSSRQALMFRTHFWDDGLNGALHALREAAADDYDIVATGYTEDAPPALPAGLAEFFHTPDDVAKLGYPGLAHLRPHHVDALCFFKKFPGYSHYWMVEYDVRYTGDWRALLKDLETSKADMLATVVQRRAENPAWANWEGFCPVDLVEAEQVKVFTPLMRLSNAGLRAVDLAYQAGWHGHFEAVWPSAIVAAGLKLEDIGGEGCFTPPGRRGKYYTTTPLNPYLTPGSFVFRPSFNEEEIAELPPRLWHPVKPAHMQEPVPPPARAGWRDWWGVKGAVKNLLAGAAVF